MCLKNVTEYRNCEEKSDVFSCFHKRVSTPHTINPFLLPNMKMYVYKNIDGMALMAHSEKLLLSKFSLRSPHPLGTFYVFSNSTLNIDFHLTRKCVWILKACSLNRKLCHLHSTHLSFASHLSDFIDNFNSYHDMRFIWNVFLFYFINESRAANFFFRKSINLFSSFIDLLCD